MILSDPPEAESRRTLYNNIFMFFTPHLIAGGAIGALTGEPASAFLLGVVSHHLLDKTPHTDIGTYYYGRWQQLGVDRSNFTISRPLDWAIGLTDVIIGCSIGFFVWRATGFNIAVLAGAIGAVLPDVVDNGPFIQLWFRKTAFGKRYHKMHWQFHYTAPPKMWLALAGVLTQLVIMGLSLWILLGGFSFS